MDFKRDERDLELISLMLRRAVEGIDAELCDQCGKCTSTCPVSRHIEDFNPRQLIAKVAMGMTNNLLKSDEIWTCTSCLKCQERCPEEVSPYDIILVLRNLAYRAGYNYPKGYDDFINRIRLNGLAQNYRKKRGRNGDMVDRESLGLPPIDKPLDMKCFNKVLDGILGA
jgi:heterodisulfide reductase subunit C